ncbi:MAG: aldehyde ferredoxin oxidoreductase C-terminal domain-containing protein [Anaerolineae bacterium]|nr:aldehyde ferredoxin oxidoreductase [Anaerolineae bacterium]MCX8066365.1 aldehyde ferredoxin oxidoreductase [Anaerolineae bacterium]MDW7992190.1 aldehyde ferredoxin oxidoreductase C-terminal domain-containing protein [Anaerolineae bacterium]
MKLLRVNMDRVETTWEPVPLEYERFGGRALIAKILLAEVPPECEPLGPYNKLILAPGLLGGTNLSSSARLSVGGKSPLTGGVKEANCGGDASFHLARLGIKAVVVEGQPAEGKLYVLHISRRGAELFPADDWRGLGTYATVAKAREKWGEDCIVLSIGPAGEMRLAAAGVACTGYEDQTCRMAARGGLGAVMGSKGLKAVVVDPAGGEAPPLADPELFRAAARRFATELAENPRTGRQGAMHLYGTSAIVEAVNEMGAFPTRNFREGRFEGVENLRGPHLREITLARGGKVGTRCMANCVIACCNVFVDPQGNPIVATLQYETIGMLGSNLGIGSLDEVARLNRICNDLGLDSIETGAALGVAAEAGLARFGDVESFAALLDEIARGTVLGRVLGQGAVVAGRVLGVSRVPAAKGQAMPAYDPRALKGNGVTYATSPMGADHTAGNAFGVRDKVNPLAVAGQREASLKLQLDVTMLDSTGLCLFARPPVYADPQLMVDLINGRFGWGWSVADLEEFKKTVIRTELEFNRRAGLTSADDRIPEYMRREPLPPHNTVFDVPDSELDTIFANL